MLVSMYLEVRERFTFQQRVKKTRMSRIPAAYK